MRSNVPRKSLSVTGAPSFSLILSQFLGESVALGLKNNQSGLFPIPTKGFCQQSGIASSQWSFRARLATNYCCGFKYPESCIITTSVDLQLHCTWLNASFDLPRKPNHGQLFNEQGKDFSGLLAHPLNHCRKNVRCHSIEKPWNLLLQSSHEGNSHLLHAGCCRDPLRVSLKFVVLSLSCQGWSLSSSIVCCVHYHLFTSCICWCLLVLTLFCNAYPAHDEPPLLLFLL